MSSRRTFAIVRFASALMLRETSSTSIPPCAPDRSPRAAAALPRSVWLAATTKPISTSATRICANSVRRAAGLSGAVVAIGIAAPRIRLSVSIGPLFDDAADVNGERLRQRRQRRRLRPRQLARHDRQLGLSVTRQLAPKRLQRLAPL